jgi:hypothetical protein
MHSLAKTARNPAFLVKNVHEKTAIPLIGNARPPCSTGVAPNGPHRPFCARVDAPLMPSLSTVCRTRSTSVPSRCEHFSPIGIRVKAKRNRPFTASRNRLLSGFFSHHSVNCGNVRPHSCMQGRPGSALLLLPSLCIYADHKEPEQQRKFCQASGESNEGKQLLCERW